MERRMLYVSKVAISGHIQTIPYFKKKLHASFYLSLFKKSMWLRPSECNDV